MSLRRLRMRDAVRKRSAAADSANLGAGSCEAPHGGLAARQPTILSTKKGLITLEVLLRLWDEMDDWLMACRQVLRRQLT